MKTLTILFFICSQATIAQISESNSVIDKTEIKGTWKSSKDKYYLTIDDSSISSHLSNPSDSAILSCPYSINGNFIEVICHPLEQAHYKVIKVNNEELICDIYILRLSKKELKAGAPNKIRRKRTKKNVRFVKQ